jgi:hypothetical protein
MQFLSSKGSSVELPNISMLGSEVKKNIAFKDLNEEFLCFYTHISAPEGLSSGHSGLERSCTGSHVRVPSRAWMFVLGLPGLCCSL